MRALKFLASGLVIGFALCPPLAGQQLPNCTHVLFCLYNQEASASDSAGIQKYSKNLIRLIVPPEARSVDIESLADRLARAEQMARAGKGRLVAEADVVRAFNELMAKVGAPSALRTDVASMRKFREHAVSIKAFPALFSAGRNGTSCNPGEAVFLLYLLMSDDGVLYERNLDTAQELMQPYNPQISGRSFGVFRVARTPQAKRLVSSYISNHNRLATVDLFNNLAATLGF
jgi:hypothetical protein